MTVARILGFRFYDWTADDGKTFPMVHFWYATPLSKGEGEKADQVKCSVRRVNNDVGRLEVGARYMIEWNQYGKIDSIVRCEDSDDPQ